MSPKTFLISICCGFAIFQHVLASSKGSNLHDVAPPSSTTISHTIYDSYLQPQNQLPDSLQRALKTFRDVEKLPSCNKMAASALLHSCATLEGDDSSEDDDLVKGPDLLLDEAKSIFATRFAVCEIAEAKGLVPNECRLFVPTEHNTRKKGLLGKISGQKITKPNVNYPIYESNTEQYLEDCRGALGKSPQLWTSYSNSRQNAVSICHAVRSEIEKDEQLHLHKVLAETTVGVHDTLRQSRETAEQATAAFHELVINVRQFHMDLHKEDHDRQAEARQMWVGLSDDMRGGVEDIMAGVRQVGETLESTNLQVTESGRQTTQMVEGMVSKMATLLDDHGKNLAIISTDAAATHEQFKYAEELFQQNVIQTIYSVTNSLEISNSLALDARQNMQELGLESANSVGLVKAIGVHLLAMGEQIQELQIGHQEMRNTVNGTHAVISELRGEAEAARTALAAITGFFTTIASFIDTLPGAAWYLGYALAFAVGFVLISLCPGGIMLLRTIFGTTIQLLQAICRNAPLLASLTIAGGYLALVEHPTDLLIRWRSGGFTTFEEVVAGVLCAFLLGVWVIARLQHRPTTATTPEVFMNGDVYSWQEKSSSGTVLPSTAEREKSGFWFNNPKSFAKKLPV